MNKKVNEKKEFKKIKENITEVEYKKLMSFTRGNETLRDNTKLNLLRTFTILFFTGLRLNEVQELKIIDIKNLLENGNVKWLGHRDDIKEQIDKCDIFVLPSFYGEGVPRTLLEAASMGKPIVTTDNVGCREVVDDGVNGFLVPVKDSKALAKKIKILIENETMRDEFGKASRKKAVEEFDVKFVVEQYLRLYNV